MKNLLYKTFYMKFQLLDCSKQPTNIWIGTHDHYIVVPIAKAKAIEMRLQMPFCMN